MARTPRTLRRRSQSKLRRPPPDEAGPRPLDFDDQNRPAPRTGEPTDPRTLRAELPKRREREAGLTGGAIPGEGVTGDDLAPETLIDEDGAGGPTVYASRDPQDAVLRVVDADSIGARDGPDEAELARVDPIDPAELARQRRKVRHAGGPMANLEPNESAAGSPGRRHGDSR